MSDQTQPDTEQTDPEAAAEAAPIPRDPETPMLPGGAVDLSKIRLNSDVGSKIEPTDLVAEMTEKIVGAVKRYSMRDDVSYAIGMVIVPQGPGVAVPMLAVTISIPSLVIDQHMQGTVMVPEFHSPQEAIDGMVQDMLNHLRTSRLEQASQLGQPPNGHAPH